MEKLFFTQNNKKFKETKNVGMKKKEMFKRKWKRTIENQKLFY